MRNNFVILVGTKTTSTVRSASPIPLLKACVSRSHPLIGADLSASARLCPAAHAKNRHVPQKLSLQRLLCAGRSRNHPPSECSLSPGRSRPLVGASAATQHPACTSVITRTRRPNDHPNDAKGSSPDHRYASLVAPSPPAPLPSEPSTDMCQHATFSALTTDNKAHVGKTGRRARTAPCAPHGATPTHTNSGFVAHPPPRSGMAHLEGWRR